MPRPDRGARSVTERARKRGEDSRMFSARVDGVGRAKRDERSPTSGAYVYVMLNSQMFLALGNHGGKLIFKPPAALYLAQSK